MQTLKISAKGQITLPKRICQALDVSPGDRILLAVEDKSVVLRGLGPASARQLAGSLSEYAKGAAAGAARPSTRKKVARAAAQEG